eukprot:gene25219-10864_t
MHLSHNSERQSRQVDAHGTPMLPSSAIENIIQRQVARGPTIIQQENPMPNLMSLVADVEPHQTQQHANQSVYDGGSIVLRNTLQVKQLLVRPDGSALLQPDKNAQIEAVLTTDRFIAEEDVVRIADEKTTILCSHQDLVQQYNKDMHNKFFQQLDVTSCTPVLSSVSPATSGPAEPEVQKWAQDPAFHGIPQADVGTRVLIYLAPATEHRAACPYNLGDQGHITELHMQPRSTTPFVEAISLKADNRHTSFVPAIMDHLATFNRLKRQMDSLRDPAAVPTSKKNKDGKRPLTLLQVLWFGSTDVHSWMELKDGTYSGEEVTAIVARVRAFDATHRKDGGRPAGATIQHLVKKHPNARDGATHDQAMDMWKSMSSGIRERTAATFDFEFPAVPLSDLLDLSEDEATNILQTMRNGPAANVGQAAAQGARRLNQHRTNPVKRMQTDVRQHKPFNEHFHMRILFSSFSKAVAMRQEARLIRENENHGKPGYNITMGEPFKCRRFWAMKYNKR